MNAWRNAAGKWYTAVKLAMMAREQSSSEVVGWSTQRRSMIALTEAVDMMTMPPTVTDWQSVNIHVVETEWRHYIWNIADVRIICCSSRVMIQLDTEYLYDGRDIPQRCLRTCDRTFRPPNTSVDREAAGVGGECKHWSADGSKSRVCWTLWQYWPDVLKGK